MVERLDDPPPNFPRIEYLPGEERLRYSPWRDWDASVEVELTTGQATLTDVKLPPDLTRGPQPPQADAGWGWLRLIDAVQGQVVLEVETGRFIAWTEEGKLLFFDWPNGQHIPIGPKDCN